MKLHAWFSEEYLKKKSPVGRLGYTWGRGEGIILKWILKK